MCTSLFRPWTSLRSIEEIAVSIFSIDRSDLRDRLGEGRDRRLEVSGSQSEERWAVRIAR
jgi:hypothetical protein